MMETFAHIAPTLGLLIFFSIFMGVVIWVALPGSKAKLQEHAKIPLKEEQNG